MIPAPEVLTVAPRVASGGSPAGCSALQGSVLDLVSVDCD